MKNFFSNKTFIISGSAQGLGLQLADLLLQQGASVILNARSEQPSENVQKIINRFPNRVVYCAGDVGIFSNAEKMVTAAIHHFHGLDGVIVNAGMSSFGLFHQHQPEVIQEMVNTNVFGMFYLCKAAIPELIRNKGSILFVSSLAAFYGLPDYALYSSTKSAMLAFQQSLAIELKDKVFVGIAWPGFIANESYKTTLNHLGERVLVPNRKSFRPLSRDRAAAQILNQIKKRKATQHFGFSGFIVRYLSRWNPAVLGLIFQWNYRKQKLETES